ncbi:hypothetical protein Hanom_Chr05g00473181 [Helianthus anomalus]
MTRKSSTCAICENSNLASICTVCVNYRVNSYGTNLTTLKSRRDSLYSKLSEVLVAKICACSSVCATQTLPSANCLFF